MMAGAGLRRPREFSPPNESIAALRGPHVVVSREKHGTAHKTKWAAAAAAASGSSKRCFPAHTKPTTVLTTPSPLPLPSRGSILLLARVALYERNNYLCHEGGRTNDFRKQFQWLEQVPEGRPHVCVRRAAPELTRLRSFITLQGRSQIWIAGSVPLQQRNPRGRSPRDDFSLLPARRPRRRIGASCRLPW